MAIGTTSLAIENFPYENAAVTETDEVAAATSAIEGPDGKIYIYLGTTTDDNPLDVSLIAFPASGGTVVKYEFTDIRNEIYNINSLELMRCLANIN